MAHDVNRHQRQREKLQRTFQARIAAADKRRDLANGAKKKMALYMAKWTISAGNVE
jgi:hypothetical protein